MMMRYGNLMGHLRNLKNGTDLRFGPTFTADLYVGEEKVAFVEYDADIGLRLYYETEQGLHLLEKRIPGPEQKEGMAENAIP